MKKPHGTLTGFLDEGCTIKGEVSFRELLRVHGRIEGAVRSEDELLVGEGGVVDGQIEVGRVIVAGEVRGTVRAKDRVVVHGTGRLLAEVFTPRLIVEEGGVIEGAVHMTENATPSRVAS